MKSVLVAVALTVGLAACSPAHTQEERTPQTNAIPGLEHWVPAKYTYTQDDTLPPNYAGVDIWKTRDFFEVLNRFRLRHHDDESLADYRRRVLQNDVITPFDYESEYAFQTDTRRAAARDVSVVHCVRSSADEPTGSCMVRFRNFIEFEPTENGPDGTPSARVTESFNLRINISDLERFSDGLNWYEEGKATTISIDTSDSQVDPNDEVGLLVVGRLVSPYRYFSEVTFEPGTRSWEITAWNDDRAIPGVPSVTRHTAIPFQPTRLVAYVIATGEILAEIRPKPD